MTAASLAAPGPRIPHEPAICPTDSDTLLPKKHRMKSKLDKRSWEYIIKSGVAGGFAGCAVSTIPVGDERIMLTRNVGKDGGGTSRSRQDPLPGL